MSIKIKQRLVSMDTDIFQVFVEETHICECDNFFKAFCGLLACIYVMNLAYPKTWEKTFTFVQNILIGLKDNEGQVSIDRRFVAVLSSINAEVDKWKFDFNYYCHCCYGLSRSYDGLWGHLLAERGYSKGLRPFVSHTFLFLW